MWNPDLVIPIITSEKIFEIDLFFLGLMLRETGLLKTFFWINLEWREIWRNETLSEPVITESNIYEIYFFKWTIFLTIERSFGNDIHLSAPPKAYDFRCILKLFTVAQLCSVYIFHVNWVLLGAVERMFTFGFTGWSSVP